MSNGKGNGPRKGYNWAKYAENYDAIFRPNQRKEPMKTPKQEQPDQPTVLPWHRATATDIVFSSMPMTVSERTATIAAIISRHDPHAAQEATTLRLLERALSHTMSTETGRIIVQDAIRVHLAAMKGSQ